MAPARHGQRRRYTDGLSRHSCEGVRLPLRTLEDLASVAVTVGHLPFAASVK